MTKSDKLHRVNQQHAETMYHIALEKIHRDRKELLKKQYAKWQTKKED